jgi:hypothetical protein
VYVLSGTIGVAKLTSQKQHAKDFTTKDKVFQSKNIIYHCNKSFDGIIMPPQDIPRSETTDTATMVRFSVLVLLLLLIDGNSLSTPPPRGSAAVPLNKQKIAVFGAGGYLGSCIFGYLQRASNLYGTGMGGAASPRNLCATFLASQAMNKVLGKNFCLAYAGEQHVKLTDMTRVDAIAARLDGYSAVVMGTMYRLEQRPVTSGTYEKGPNDKTLEFYLDQPRRGETVGPQTFDIETHLTMFQNTLEACQRVGIQHAVVLETPQTENASAFLSLLKASKIPCTYIRCRGELTNSADHTYWKGVQGDLSIQALTLDDIDNPATQPSGSPIYREDLAALVCQSLQSLLWSESRCLSVTSAGDWEGAIQVAKGRYDRNWCTNSQVLARKLVGIN